MFISLEGPEGAGKSTLAGQLQARLRRAGYRVLLTYEPGGTALGRRVREVVLHGLAPGEHGLATGETGQARGEAGNMGAPLGPRAETLLFCAARAQLVDEIIRPHLAAGGVVLCDRYADSTLAYQCYGRGLPLAPVRAVLDFATDGLWPDLTILLDLDAGEGLRRKRQGDRAGPDRFESEAIEFHRRVRRGYRELAAAEPRRWLVVDAAAPLEQVVEGVWEQLARRLAPHQGESQTPEVSPDHPSSRARAGRQGADAE